jgi:hypothetical protein
MSLPRRSFVALLLGLELWGFVPVGAWAAEEKPAAKSESKATEKVEKEGRGSPRRLPAHYKEVVTQEQREAIYRIQDEYGGKMAELKARMDELQRQQAAKIEALLTAEQKRRITVLKAAKEAKRHAKPAAKP